MLKNLSSMKNVPILVCVISLSGCATYPTAPADRAPEVAYSPYWYVDGETESALEIKNMRRRELVLSAELTTSAGETIALPPISVPPLATKEVPVEYEAVYRSAARQDAESAEARWGTGGLPGSAAGSAKLTVLSGAPDEISSFAAWIVITSEASRIGFVSPFHHAHRDHARQVVLDGVWWMPYPDTEGLVGLRNTSEQDIELEVEIDADDRPIKKEVRLPAQGGTVLAMSDLLEGQPAVGGITLRYTAPADAAGGLVARGFLVNEKRGFATPFNLYPRSAEADDEETTLHAPLAYFGRLDRLVPGQVTEERYTDFTPHLILRNVSDRPMAFDVALLPNDDADGYTSIELPSYTLDGGAVLEMDLAEQISQSERTIADGVAGLRIRHGGGPADLIGELWNLDEGSGLVLYDRMRNADREPLEEQVAISFRVDETSRSYLIMRNTAEEPKSLYVALDTGAQDPYDLSYPDVPPDASVIVDVAELRDGQVPDPDGDRLPQTPLLGGARILGEDGAFVSSDPTFRIVGGTSIVDYTCTALVVSTAPPGFGGGAGGGNAFTCTVEMEREVLGARWEAEGDTEPAQRVATVTLHKLEGARCRRLTALPPPFFSLITSVLGSFDTGPQVVVPSAIPGLGHRVLAKVVKEGATAVCCATVMPD